jgi:hypothetical protein
MSLRGNADLSDPRGACVRIPEAFQSALYKALTDLGIGNFRVNVAPKSASLAADN